MLFEETSGSKEVIYDSFNSYPKLVMILKEPKIIFFLTS
jgi:hypothetical protein